MVFKRKRGPGAEKKNVVEIKKKKRIRRKLGKNISKPISKLLLLHMQINQKQMCLVVLKRKLSCLVRKRLKIGLHMKLRLPLRRFVLEGKGRS
ncbi:hypothetical protein CsatA_000833 [Cannabis sativa]